MNLTSPRPSFLGILPLAVAFGMMSPVAKAATITMAASDQAGQSSFNTGIYWSDGLAPQAGNGYSASASFIRTPTGNADYTFAGDYLQILNTGIVYNGSTGRTITINDLRMQRYSTISNTTGGGTTFTLAGNIFLDPTNVTTASAAGFQLRTGNSGFVVSSTISGGGILKISTNGTPTQFTTGVTLTHANNTYTGGTLVETNAYLIAQANGTLGTGNVTITGGKIKFELAATNNYIADTASLVLATGLATGAVELNYSGTDVIAGISLNGGSTFLTAGTYDAASLNALYGSSVFTGAGSFSVIPEPSVIGLSLLGLAGAFMGYRKTRREKNTTTL